MKTVSVLLSLCLHIGVDPPDVIKTSPCARLECWINPLAYPPKKALEEIGKTLQLQYERWQPKAKYKLCLDPDLDAIKKICISLRRNAKDERVLFHYNGHGVPKPTNNGEIWVFNKTFTQYIPLSLYDLQVWLGTPSIVVFDCSCAGLVVQWFNKFAEQREQEVEKANKKNPGQAQQPTTGIREYILLGACGVNESLPTNPDLPADVFTSCLTTPILIALKWFCSQTIISGVTSEMIDRIPGKSNDRRTALGELNWIFTAITDTIAWNVLPQKLFQKLFREDLLVASLFRNFLLAERIMRSCKCMPVSHPKIPPTYNHSMWQAWDLAADHCLSQLPMLLSENNTDYEYQHSVFFADQLTAFEVWLEFGTESKKPPEQLPIVLQVLLSQQHRQRALDLLAQFIDLGYWAVNQALSVGIFPYVLKLLSSPGPELRKVLVFIWAKILVLDRSCQLDLVKENGQAYFISVLVSNSSPNDQRIQSAFILSVICNQCKPGQNACLTGKLLKICVANIHAQDPLLRRWAVLCLAKLWENNETAKAKAVKADAHRQLCCLLTDPIPEVRAAAVYALGTFILRGVGVTTTPDIQTIELNLGLTFANIISTDASPLVRREIIVALHGLVISHEEKLKQVELNIMMARTKMTETKGPNPKSPQLQDSRGKLQTANSSSNLNSPHGHAPSRQTSSQHLLASPQVSSANLGHHAQAALNASSGSMQNFANVNQPLVNTNSNNNTPSSELSTSSNQLGVSSSQASSTSPSNVSVDEKKDGAPEDDDIYVFLWRLILSLMNDPYPQFSALVHSVISKIKTEVRAELEKSRSGSFPPMTANAKQGKSGSFFEIDPFSTSKATPVNSPKPADRKFPKIIEVKSNFYEWSCTYFSQPMLLEKDEDETAPAFSEQKWRNQRCAETIRDATLLAGKGVKSLDNETAILENIQYGNNVSKLCFHPFDNFLVVCDQQHSACIWNWEEGVKISKFSNTQSTNSRISDLSIINEHSNPLICIASDDGVIRFWEGGFEANQTTRLVTAWRVLDDIAPLKGHSQGMVFQWQKKRDYIAACGNSQVIKLWDINKEIHFQDIPTDTPYCITSVCMDHNSSNMIVVGAADGALRLFDIRNNKYQPVGILSEHKGWVVNNFLPKCLNLQLFSASNQGDVKCWDLRNMSASTKTYPAHDKPSVSSFAVHDYAPVFAIGTQDQRIRVLNFAGDQVSLIRYHDGFLGQRIGPISDLAFHQYKLRLAAGATDSIVSIYGGEMSKDQFVQIDNAVEGLNNFEAQ